MTTHQTVSSHLTKNSWSCCALVLATALLTASTALAGPHHWGFGFSYLAAIEESAGTRRLVVYEPPLRAKDFTWPARWLDRTTVLTDVPTGGLAVGNFWPSSPGKEYLATVQIASSSAYVNVYDPPEFFCVRAWTRLSTGTGTAVSGTLLATATGDLLATGKDQLILATQNGSTVNVVLLTPPGSKTGTTWTKAATLTLPGAGGTLLGLAAGDFWKTGQDCLAVATSESGTTQLRFYEYSGSTLDLVVADAAELPALIPGGLAAADYEKDGFDILTLTKADGTFELRVAPARDGQEWDPGPQYNGQALSGQWMPGNGGPASLVVMSGTFGATATSRVACAAGRLFGYIVDDYELQLPVSTGLDAQIAFVHRSPTKDEVPPYGWPTFGAPVTFTFNLSNCSGTTAVPADSVRLKVWVNRPNRNPDTDPTTCDSPDYDFPITESIPAYTAPPNYVQRSVSVAWPYSLVPAGPGASWQRVNVYDVGMRYIVAVLEYAGDTNLRNNRYEVPMSGMTGHPVFREWANLLDRGPTVLGDPPSQEYCRRKMADAVTCMWERSATADGQDVLHACYLDSYEIGWPEDTSDPSAAWAAIQVKYEGWRGQDIWAGRWGCWERFNWTDGNAELHETGHLFHPLGDLYGLWLMPVWTGLAHMADGRPVQMNTWEWPADSYGPGLTKISWPACEMMRTCVAGARVNSVEHWWTVKPDHTYVRVLDRDGQPVAGAVVTAWAYMNATPQIVATTGADGRADISAYWGTSNFADIFGRKHYYCSNSDAIGDIITVKIGAAYQDCGILGVDTLAAHSRHASVGFSFAQPSGWTWDLPTNYSAAAPLPSFTLTLGVQGRVSNLGITGGSGTYRLYRRWEPAYERMYLGEYTSSGGTLTITQDMNAPDSFGGGRFRAIYEVTEVTASGESLPRSVSVTGVDNARGIAPTSDGKLLVTANAGMANPWAILFDDTTPYWEYFYHYRYGHTGAKAVPSKLTAGRYYATLLASDTDPDDYRFDIAVPPDVRPYIGDFWASSASNTTPYWVQVDSAALQKLHPGDVIWAAHEAKITQVIGNKLYLSAAIFDAPTTSGNFSADRYAGRPGISAVGRQLQSPRGLDVITLGGQEYIVIADTGNRRVVVWDSNTGYLAHWQATDTTARPAAIVAHPAVQGQFFALDRRASGTSYLYLFSWSGTALSVVSGYPVAVPVGDLASVAEMGLAATAETGPERGGVRLAITDASAGHVLELAQNAGKWETIAVYDRATGVYAGDEMLSQPTDVTYLTVGNLATLYAVDGLNRVVRLAQAVAPPANVWGTINGPVNDSSAYNHVGTDGTALYVGFGNNQFWKYEFPAGNPTPGHWSQLATPPRTLNDNCYGDLAYQDGYLYSNAAGSAGGRTMLRYQIATNTWEVWQRDGVDVTTEVSNALIMDPAQAGAGLAIWHAGNYWIRFDWDAGTTNNSWMSTYYDLSAEGCSAPSWVSRNEDVATDGAGTYWATHNDWSPDLGSGDVVYRWTGLAANTHVHKVTLKPWQAGCGQSLEFISAALTPSRHDELWLIRGMDAASQPNEGFGAPTSDWARLDLTNVSAGWTTGTLPGPVTLSGELVRIGNTLLVRGDGAAWYYMRLAPPGDLNGDGVIDAADLATFGGCMTGPDNSASSGCTGSDLNGDGDVDLMDYATLQSALTTAAK